MARSRPAPLTPAQIAARQRWQSKFNLPILLAAFIPLFVTSPKSFWVSLVVGVGSWLIFVTDLIVQHRIDPDYLRRRNGRIDLLIVILTFPYYLIPGLGGASAILLLARLGRVARVLMATKGLRRLVQRLGKVAIVAALVVSICSIGAYEAEHSTNPGYATVGDAFWWGIVTLTTVGYGDIVPKTTAGRFFGIAIMFTGVAVLGVLAGSLAALFNIGGTDDDEETKPKPKEGTVHAEIESLRADLRAIEARLGSLTSRV